MQKIIRIYKQEFSFRLYNFIPLISFVFIIMGFKLYGIKSTIMIFDLIYYIKYLVYKIYLDFPNPLIFPQLFCKKILGMFILFIGSFSKRCKIVRMLYSLILFILFISSFLIFWESDEIKILNDNKFIIFFIFLLSFLLQLLAVFMEELYE
ncbi:hypothetical protein [Wielerella bovis]|uniref:hypothetical protein n=1 Tax=Wielerella bovis TaxID=2917790 RepID=UPI00201A0C12|nr:hypothetical protein [Wielerella bovis]ULJ60066.1 hypothetical protein MIS44_10460 [Wielerella bovis]